MIKFEQFILNNWFPFDDGKDLLKIVPQKEMEIIGSPEHVKTKSERQVRDQLDFWKMSAGINHGVIQKLQSLGINPKFLSSETYDISLESEIEELREDYDIATIKSRICLVSDPSQIPQTGVVLPYYSTLTGTDAEMLKTVIAETLYAGMLGDPNRVIAGLRTGQLRVTSWSENLTHSQRDTIQCWCNTIRVTHGQGVFLWGASYYHDGKMIRSWYDPQTKFIIGITPELLKKIVNGDL